MKKTFTAGTVLTILVTVIAWLGWKRDALIPAASFGLLATAIQIIAVRTLKPALSGPFPALVRAWAAGMGLRVAGVVLFAVAVAIDPAVFAPLPSALGYLGVVVPLLFLETRLAQ